MPEVAGGATEFNSSLNLAAFGLADISNAALDCLSAFYIGQRQLLAAINHLC